MWWHCCCFVPLLSQHYQNINLQHVSCLNHTNTGVLFSSMVWPLVLSHDDMRSTQANMWTLTVTMELDVYVTMLLNIKFISSLNVCLLMQSYNFVNSGRHCSVAGKYCQFVRNTLKLTMDSSQNMKIYLAVCGEGLNDSDIATLLTAHRSSACLWVIYSSLSALLFFYSGTSDDEMCNFYIMYYMDSKHAIPYMNCMETGSRELFQHIPAEANTPIAVSPGDMNSMMHMGSSAGTKEFYIVHIAYL